MNWIVVRSNISSLSTTYNSSFDIEILIISEFRAIYDERSNHTEVEGVHQDSHFLRFDRYNNLDQIEEYLFRIREEYPKIVSIVEIGKTYENRSMYLMKLGKKSKEPPTEPRPAIWIDVCFGFCEVNLVLISGNNSRKVSS